VSPRVLSPLAPVYVQLIDALFRDYRNYLLVQVASEINFGKQEG
jgi:hypothetical protein